MKIRDVLGREVMRRRDFPVDLGEVGSGVYRVVLMDGIQQLRGVVCKVD